MSEHETRDFMSVDSFSQLPFIRPSPKPSNFPVRLFGYDFPQNLSSKETSKNNTTVIATTTTSKTNEEKAIVTRRKFECHYCCRNFPTSQALGGHQNAHKRERQQAKRAHLQSIMVAEHAHHHHHTAIAEGQVYGILNYHGLAGSNPIAWHGGDPHNHRYQVARFGIEPPTEPPPHYPSWTSSSGVGARFNGGLGSVSHPIIGSPLPGLGMVHSDNKQPMPLPLFESRPVATLPAGGAISLSSSSSSSNSQSEKDQNVSLDLHL